jgi:hypothetical protein
MSDLITMLRSECENARLRVESAKRAVVQAENDFAQLNASLQIVLRNHGQHNDAKGNQHRPPVNSNLKYNIFKNALLSAGRPLKSSEIIEKIVPQVSESYVYHLLGELRNNGELREENGKYSLVGVNGNGHHASAGVAEPDFAGFLEAVSGKGKRFLQELKRRPHGVDFYDISKVLGFHNSHQLGGLTGGGLSKYARKYHVDLDHVYRREETFPEGKRTVKFYPGKLLLEHLEEEKPAI